MTSNEAEAEVFEGSCPNSVFAAPEDALPATHPFDGVLSVTCFRFGHDRPDTQDRYDALRLPRIADALRPL